MLSNRRDIEIEWGDCDAAGIVFYPRYFEMFDAATAALFEKAFGMKKIAWTKRFGIVGTPMVDTGATFRLPSTYGDVVVIESRLTAVNRSSIEIAHRLLKGEAVAIEAHEKRVWAAADPDSPGRLMAVAIADDVRALLMAA
jgi:4-hydroxybenzoyl-CoA thioesterase